MFAHQVRRMVRSVVAAGSVLTLAVAGLAAPAVAVPAPAIRSVYHDPGPAQVARYIRRNAPTPYQGWTSWDLQATKAAGRNPQGDYSWLTAAHVLAQGRAMATKLAAHGYRYVNIDAGWWRHWDWTPEYDANGRPAVDAARFPDGIAPVVRTLHAEGLEVGIYLPVGLEKGAYDNGDFPIAGTTGCTTHDIVYPDLRTTNGWDSSYKIDFSRPCSQFYLDSIAHELAGWGIDYLKLDGVGPGSFKSGPNYDNTADVRGWATALAGSGRRIHFELSWSLDHDDIATWQRWSNGWRIDTDVDCYCDTLVTWDQSVKQRFSDVLAWTGDARRGGWNDLDSLDVGDGALDGLTRAERQTATTLWAIEAAPLYTGDDLTQLDRYGISLLTNDTMIAIDQAGRPARPVSTATPQQVWSARLPNGRTVVALFNLGSGPAPVTAHLADLGLGRRAQVSDVWRHRSRRIGNGTISATLPAHGSALYLVRSQH